MTQSTSREILEMTGVNVSRDWEPKPSVTTPKGYWSSNVRCHSSFRDGSARIEAESTCRTIQGCRVDVIQEPGASPQRITSTPTAWAKHPTRSADPRARDGRDVACLCSNVIASSQAQPEPLSPCEMGLATCIECGGAPVPLWPQRLTHAPHQAQ